MTKIAEPTIPTPRGLGRPPRRRWRCLRARLFRMTGGRYHAGNEHPNPRSEPDCRRGRPHRCDARVSAECRAPAPGLPGLLAELEWRGILHATTPGLAERLATGTPIAAYIGFDPTADTLHVGHLIPIFGLIRLQRRGGKPVALVGGGTGMIGDPSGRSAERNLLDVPTLEHNVAAIRGQLERFLDFSPGPDRGAHGQQPRLARPLSLIDYLRDVGKHFTVPVHAGQGLGPAAPRARPLVHRVQLHDPPGVRLRHALPPVRGGDADGRRRPVGQHHRRPRAHPPHDRRRRRREPRPRHRLQAAARTVGRQVRQVRGRRVRLARPAPDDAVRLLPVLAQRGRPRRRRPTCAGSRSGTRTRSRRSRPRPPTGPRPARPSAGWRFDVTARVHGEVEARAAVEVSAALFQREPVADPALLARIHAATNGPSATSGCARGRGRGAPRGDRPGAVPGRGPAADLRRRGHGQRRADHGPRDAVPAPVARRVARGPSRQAEPGGGPGRASLTALAWARSSSSRRPSSAGTTSLRSSATDGDRGCWCQSWRGTATGLGTAGRRDRAPTRCAGRLAAASPVPARVPRLRRRASSPGGAAWAFGRDLPRLRRSRTLPGHRRRAGVGRRLLPRPDRVPARGVASALLAGVVEAARAAGAPGVEAYPVDPGDDGSTAGSPLWAWRRCSTPPGSGGSSGPVATLRGCPGSWFASTSRSRARRRA